MLDSRLRGNDGNRARECAPTTRPDPPNTQHFGNPEFASVVRKCVSFGSGLRVIPAKAGIQREPGS
ncbi:MAG TPA: hypothetical protein P5569_06795, partial [Candidatus Latescibacteria bacterium]|nr:hypothetical protein [Candidatus Latescibacterota bacterium]